MIQDVHDFTFNPCRQTIFDIFQLDKSEIDTKTIRTAANDARRRLKIGHITLRDGSELTMSEAEFNALEKVLYDPLKRLQAEQLVHHIHLFSQDEALSHRLQAIHGSHDVMQELLVELRESILSLVGHFIPALPPPLLEDDMPWPEPPGPCPVESVPLQQIILQDA